MSPRVREIDPDGEGGTVDEIVVQAPSGDGGTDLGPGATAGGRGAEDGATIDDPADHAHPAADELGPNGHEVLGLVHRAAALTDAQCRALEEEAGWRWFSINPIVGSTMPAARARALVLGRRDGRADAIVVMDAAIHTVLRRGDGAKAHGSRLLTCVTNAGLAVLVRDLIDPETFEMLHGPWGAVMHG